MKKTVVFIAFIMIFAALFAACTPSQYTKGVEIDENYPDDVLEIYDDAIVFESESRFDKVMISLGTEDDLEDIVEYYRDFYEYKKISPAEELGDDEYTSQFTCEGYEFEIEVEEASGDAKEYFEFIIEISVKEAEEAEKTADGEQADGENDADSQDSEAAQMAGDLQQKTVLEGETPLEAADKGSWYSDTVSDAAGNPKYADCNIYFADEKSGSYHYFDYTAKEKLDSEFTYVIANGVLALDLDNGERVLFDAYFDNGQLHLLNQETDEKMYMYNWEKESGMTPNLTEFTAYGSWISYDSGSENPILLALWEDGKGYFANWFGKTDESYITWEKDGSSASFKVKGSANENIALDHRGNVLIVTTEDGKKMNFFRVAGNAVAGVYEISQTNDGEVGTWEATLNLDGSATHRISSGRLTFNYDNSDWYINPLDGMLYAFIFGEYASFYYYYNESELILHEPTESLDYTFDKTE